MEYHNRKNKVLVNSDRKISRSHMAGINLIKMYEAPISVRTPLEALPITRKISIIIIIIIITYDYGYSNGF